MPNLPDCALQAELSSLFAAVQRHFLQVVVPLWLGPGWNPRLGLPHEALHADGTPLPAQRYRAMACARQLYLFASLIDEPRVPEARAQAARLFESLQRHFRDPRHGGWYYSLDAQGAPLDRRKDLYTHAFVIFACAHYLAKVASAEVEAALDEALALVQGRFADGDGLYQACLAEDGSGLASGTLQNPLMHLTEAWLATLAVRPNPALQAALLALTDALGRRFVEPQAGRVLERPLGSADNWYEPGHQFEWFYLLQASPLLRGGALHAALSRAFPVTQAQGVDRGAVLAQLGVDGRRLDPTQRIWAQAEYLRALTLRPDSAAQVLQQLQHLQRQFLHPRGWAECLSATGEVARADMPSTTPYHLATCYAGLAAYLG